MDLEETGGLSMNEVSVVLDSGEHDAHFLSQGVYKNVASTSNSGRDSASEA